MVGCCGLGLQGRGGFGRGRDTGREGREWGGGSFLKPGGLQSVGVPVVCGEAVEGGLSREVGDHQEWKGSNHLEGTV